MHQRLQFERLQFESYARRVKRNNNYIILHKPFRRGRLCSQEDTQATLRSMYAWRKRQFFVQVCYLLPVIIYQAALYNDESQSTYCALQPLQASSNFSMIDYQSSYRMPTKRLIEPDTCQILYKVSTSDLHGLLYRQCGTKQRASVHFCRYYAKQTVEPEPLTVHQIRVPSVGGFWLSSARGWRVNGMCEALRQSLRFGKHSHQTRLEVQYMIQRPKRIEENKDLRIAPA